MLFPLLCFPLFPPFCHCLSYSQKKLRDGDILSDKAERTKKRYPLCVFLFSLDLSYSVSVTGGGLLHSFAVIERNVRMLTREYQLIYHHAGDFDERQFLASNEVGTPTRMAAQYVDYYEFDTKAGKLMCIHSP